MNGGTVTDLQPAGYGLSTANGVGGGQQVGYAFSKDGQTQRAMLWRGTAASAVDLYPAGATRSQAFDTDGTIQVGSAVIGETARAALWRGSSFGWVDLTPTHLGFDSAGVRATDGGRQVGGAGNTTGGPALAFLWEGSAHTAVPLRPVGSLRNSEAFDVRGNQQVGMSFDVGAPGWRHATLWTGDPDSGVTCTPRGM
jgi:hypothetical protein